MAFGKKNIQEALFSLKLKGRSIQELEGLLVNSDDLVELLQSIP